MTAEDVLEVIENWLSSGNWQVTEGPYSWKNNKCIHGSFGYEGCEMCMEDSLSNLLVSLRERVVK